MYCEKCGAELLPDALFCEECGTRVKEDVPAPMQEQTPIDSQPMPPQNKSGSKIGIIILVIVLLAAAAASALWFTGVIGGGKPGENQPEAPSTQIAQPSEKPEPQSTPEPSQAGAQENDGSPGVNGESMQFSTTETPTTEDFAWFTDKAENWVYGMTPADAYTLEDFYALLGSWKGLQMIYDYDGTVLGYGYFTATFDESGPDIDAALNWLFIDWADGSHEELTDRADESMTGSFAAPTLALGEAGNRIELIFYAMDGKQYAEGKWTVQSGEEVRVALVRP